MVLPNDLTRLDEQLRDLYLRYIQSNYRSLATKAAEQQRSHVEYLGQLIEGEAMLRWNRRIERRIDNARFPVLKTLETLGRLHGYGIARRIEQTSGDLLAVNYGTLYPALVKLEQVRPVMQVGLRYTIRDGAGSSLTGEVIGTINKVPD